MKKQLEQEMANSQDNAMTIRDYCLDILMILNDSKVGPIGSTDGESITDNEIIEGLTIPFQTIVDKVDIDNKTLYKCLYMIDKGFKDCPAPYELHTRSPLVKNTPEGKACIQALNKFDWESLFNADDIVNAYKKENEMSEETKTTETKENGMNEAINNEGNVEVLRKLIHLGEVSWQTAKVCKDGMPDIKKVYAAMDRRNPGNMSKNYAVYINTLYLSKLGYTDHDVCEIMTGVHFKKQGDIHVACEPGDGSTSALKAFFDGKSGDARQCFASMLKAARQTLEASPGIATSINSELSKIKPTVKTSFVKEAVDTVLTKGDNMTATTKKTNGAIKSHREKRIAQLEAYPANSKGTRYFESAHKERCVQVKIELEREKLLKKEKKIDEKALRTGAEKAVKKFTKKDKNGNKHTLYSVKLKGFTGRAVAVVAETAAKVVIYGYKCPVIGYGVAACDLSVTYIYGKTSDAYSWIKEKGNSAYSWFKGLFTKKTEEAAPATS